METVDLSDESVPLLSVAKTCTDDLVFIRELTPPLPSLEDHLWLNNESGLSAKTVKAFDRDLESLFGSEFFPVEVKPKAKLECSECGKEFRTTKALNKHLCTHKPDIPHVCNTCQQRFKYHHHLMVHMLTHTKKTANCYNNLGCHKMFCNLHDKKCGTTNPTEPSPVLCECPNPPAVTEDPSSSKSFNSLFHFPPKHAAVSDSCETRYSSTEFVTGNRFPEDNLLKLPAIHESRSLAAVDSDQRAPVFYPQPEISTVDPIVPDYHIAKSVNLLGWEDDAGMEYFSRPLKASSKKSQQDLLKNNLQHLKPDYKLLFSGGAQACFKSDSDLGSVAPQSHQKMSHHRPPSPNKKGKKKATKTANFPAPSPSSLRPKTKRCSRPHVASLISPSQVAMASFSTESTNSLTIKSPTASSTKMDDQALSMFSTVQVKNESRTAGQIQEFQRFQLSPLVIPVSVPVLDKEAPLNEQSAQSVPTQTEMHKKRPVKDLSIKSHHPDLLRSLIIPNLAESGGLGGRATGGYPSQLRSPTYLVDHLLRPGVLHPPYTPPPMLSPLRPGTGLYFNTLPQCQPCPPTPCSYTTSMDGTDTISLMTGSKVVNIEPKINIGPSFQAEIPPLRNQLLMLYDEHPAELVWAPWGDLPTNLETQQKVTEFLNMCCSSVLPGGGTNIELALHYLHEVHGNVLAALDLLLLRGDYGTLLHPQSVYHFTGSDHWSAQEKKLFRKALFKHNKDFQLIHKTLQTKSVAQCVEYYYTMKKMEKFKKSKKGIHKKGTTAKNLVEFHIVTEKSETGSEIWRSFDKAVETCKGPYVENEDITFREYSRGFHKVKRHRAYMRGQRETEQE